MEVVNTFVNILPAVRAGTPQAKRLYFTRAGIFNLILAAACLVYAYA